MNPQPTIALADHFADLPDPRVERARRHELLDIITITICAVISGADSFNAIALYGRAKEEWLKTFLRLPSGIPSHDTFGRFFAHLDPHAFQRCFGGWIEALSRATDLTHYAIDGKTLCSTFDAASGKAALHLVSAWATANQLTLGQVAVAEQSNEITAIPRLLEILHLRGALVTIDAMGCQKDIAAQIRAGGADYILALKGNQERLYDDVQQAFAEHLDRIGTGTHEGMCETSEQGHGRREVRSYCLLTDLDGLRDRALWPDLRAVCLVRSERTEGGKTGEYIRYYIGSLDGTVEEYAQAIRGHWGIENSLHWVLDVTFREDEDRTRTGHAAENLAWLRRMAVSLLKNDQTCQESIHGKRLKAGWDNNFLLQVLQGVNAKQEDA
jgi:predicted transposase YbfD/YdcC